MKSELLKLVDQYNELTAKGQKMVRDAADILSHPELRISVKLSDLLAINTTKTTEHFIMFGRSIFRYIRL